MLLKRQLLLQILLPITLLIVIPVLLLNIATTSLLDTLQKDTTQTHLDNMTQAKYYLDQYINENRTLIWQLSRNDKIKTLDSLRQDKTLKDYEKLLDGNNTRKNLIFDTQAYQFCMLFADTTIALTAKGVCEDFENFYGSVYQLGGFSYEEVKALSASRQTVMQFYPASNVRLDGQEDEGILCLNPNDALKKSNSFILLNKENLTRILRPLNLPEGFSYITDREGNPLFSFGESPPAFTQLDLPNSTDVEFLPDKIYGTENVVVHTSLLNGLHLVSVNPKNAIFRNVHFMQMMVWCLNITCILAGFLLAWLFLVRKTKKLRSALGLLMPQENQPPRNVYERIEQSVLQLVSRNHELKSMVSSHHSILQDLFWEQVLEGRLSQDANVANLAHQAHLDLCGDYYCLVLLSIPTPVDSLSLSTIQEIEASREKLTNCLKAEPALAGFVHSIGLQQIVVVVRLAQKNKENYREAICEALSELNDFTELPNLSLTAGVPVDTIPALYYQYTLCKNRLNSCILSENVSQGILWCEDSPQNLTDKFYFPYELEVRLLSAIRSGEIEVVKECFRSLLNNNFVSRSVSPVMTELLMGRLKLMILSAHDEQMALSLEELYSKMDLLKSDALRLSYLLTISEEMCAFYRTRVNENQSSMQQDILDYLHSQLSNVDLSLSSTAEHFHFSESYFSRIFKALVGETFSAYVERIRMEEADRLLLETTLKIEEIALQVSYVNVGSFRRAFKRHIGVTPSQRRDK